MTRSSLLAITVLAASAAHGFQMKDQDNVVFLNANQENVSCLAPRSAKPGPTTFCPNVPDEALHLIQGRRMEFMVVNRPFLADYSLSVDQVTKLVSGPQIRALEEAANLKTPLMSQGAAPVAKGGVDVISARTAFDVLNALLDETTATKPELDLEADNREIEREQARIRQEIQAFKYSYTLLRGAAGVFKSLGGTAGAPDMVSVLHALQDEIHTLTNGPNPQDIYHNESEFRNANTRVQDLIVTVKLLGSALAGSNLPQTAQTIEADIAQYEKNVGTFGGNIEAARDAVELLQHMFDVIKPTDSAHATGHDPASVRTDLRLQQVKALLTLKLRAAAGDAKPVTDDAEMSNLLNKYVQFLSASEAVSVRRKTSLTTAVGAARLPGPLEFRADLHTVRDDIDSDLPQAVETINAIQGELLARVNFIYDHSAVSVPMFKQIDLSAYTGNLDVSYTIRRVETFVRYTVPQVAPPGGVAPAGGAAISALPGSAPPVGAAAAVAAAGSTPSSPPAQGVVVVPSAHFQVHDYYHATVVGFFAFGYFKDQSISKQPASTTSSPTAGCTGAPPDANCFTPIATNSLFQSDVVIGPLYYLQPTDTYPGAPRTARQKLGFFGGVSATRLNHFYGGIGYEPKVGVQLLAGIHLGTTTALQQPYSLGTPADMSGDFPTHDIHRVGFFIGAGFDLNIFRKLFGSVTNIGTSASSTQGQ